MRMNLAGNKYASSCMFTKTSSERPMDQSTTSAAQHSSSRPATDRFPLGANDAVEKQGRRRSLGINPNRRQSGRRTPATISHPQDRAPSAEELSFLTPRFCLLSPYLPFIPPSPLKKLRLGLSRGPEDCT